MRSELDGGTVDREWPRGDGAPRGRCCVNVEAMVEGATGTAGSLSRGDGAAWRRSGCAETAEAGVAKVRKTTCIEKRKITDIEKSNSHPRDGWRDPSVCIYTLCDGSCRNGPIILPSDRARAAVRSSYMYM